MLCVSETVLENLVTLDGGKLLLRVHEQDFTDCEQRFASYLFEREGGHCDFAFGNVFVN